jgi:hypothetical protein
VDRAAQIEERIRWRIGRQFPCLPVGRTFFFEQLNDVMRDTIASVANAHEVGNLVLVAVDGDECWTVIGTSGVVSKYAGKVHVFQLSEIADLHNRDPMPEGLMPEGLSQEERFRLKTTWEYLRVVDRAGQQHDIWLPAGTEAFAFWGTLLMLGRMCAGMPNFYD